MVKEQASENKPAQDSLEYIENGGALFVLESKGTWVHAGYHLTCALSTPSLLSLPFAISRIGWGPGVAALCMQASVSLYAYYTLSSVLDKMEEQGQRCLRFRDLTQRVLGFTWSHYLVSPAQFVVCFISVVGYILLGGQTMKGIYIAIVRDGNVTQHDFTTIFGGLVMILSQMPSFHSLRHFTLISNVMCVTYAICAIIGSIIGGTLRDAPQEYSVGGSPLQRLFSAFGCISMMAETYGNPVLVEVQATLASPIKGKMAKALGMCYGVTTLVFFSVAIVGYWAFGSGVDGIIFGSMLPGHGHVPKLIFLIGNTCVLLQVVVVTVLFSQPTFEVLEGAMSNTNKGKYSKRNLVPRLLARSLFILLATIIANFIPCFPDIIALTGSIGFIPLCIVLPLLVYNKTYCGLDKFKSKRVLANYLLATLFCGISIIGCISSIRQIAIDVTHSRA